MRSTKATIHLHNAHMGNQWSQLFKDCFTLCNLLPFPFVNITIPEYFCKKKKKKRANYTVTATYIRTSQ